MKTLEITQATKSLSDYARQVGRDALIVLKNGKPVAVLSSAKGMDAESIALANNPKFVAMIQRSRSRHTEQRGVSAAELRRNLGLTSPKPRKRVSAR
jgi:PHD/YefM family antitoxin component YafN of YafNO toxin-antitoxin module